MSIGSTDELRRRVCFVTSAPITLSVFFRAHLAVLRQEYDVTLVSNGSAHDVAPLLGSHVGFVPLRIERRISIARDATALVNLYRLFRRERFNSVHSMTPKAGLLAMVAARFAGVPHRIHTFTGQVWATRTGVRRMVLKSLDRLLSTSATALLADSESQSRFLIENGIGRPGQIAVLADGSVAGVDLERFRPRSETRGRMRRDYGISDDAVLFMFLGRLSLDKGLGDLARAFAITATKAPSVHLLVVGPDEDGFESELSRLAACFPGRVHSFGFADRPEDHMAAADVFCLPSYREGFGVVIIEAAAVGLPAIASRIYGITDAVEDGVTGLLHTAGSASEIAQAMQRLASDETLRRRMGDAARARVATRFSEARLTTAFCEFYRTLFGRQAHP